MPLPPCLAQHEMRAVIETTEGETLNKSYGVVRHILKGNYSLKLLIQGISNDWLLLVLTHREGSEYILQHPLHRDCSVNISVYCLHPYE